MHHKLLYWVRKIEDFFMVLCLGSIMILTVVNVALRYFFKSGFLWGEEVIGFCIILSVMFGSARALQHNAHTRLSFFVEKMPHTLQVVINLLTYALMLLMLIVTFYYGVIFANKAIGQTSYVLRIPMSIPYSFIPIGMVAIFIELILCIYDYVKQEIINRGDSK